MIKKSCEFQIDPCPYHCVTAVTKVFNVSTRRCWNQPAPFTSCQCKMLYLQNCMSRAGTIASRPLHRYRLNAGSMVVSRFQYCFIAAALKTLCSAIGDHIGNANASEITKISNQFGIVFRKHCCGVWIFRIVWMRSSIVGELSPLKLSHIKVLFPSSVMLGSGTQSARNVILGQIRLMYNPPCDNCGPLHYRKLTKTLCTVCSKVPGTFRGELSPKPLAQVLPSTPPSVSVL